MSYHNDPIINNLMLTIINDGNGSECGMTYAQRCAAADTGIAEFRDACRIYNKKRVEVYKLVGAKRVQILEAASLIQEYYRQHNAEK